MGTDDTTASQDASTANGDGNVTACMLIIGNELLSGRTQDKNLSFLGIALGEIGIDMREARIIPDDPAIIVDTLNTCRARFDYVFTTGGIGPTHDDITADCVAEAFGVPLEYHSEAMARLAAHYETMGTEFNEARQRMARIPKGGGLIDNPVSTAPGFVIENVYVMAGVPKIMQAMAENILPMLNGGEQLSSITVSAQVPEGQIAAAMGALQGEYEDVNLWLYPFYGPAGAGVSVVARARDQARLGAVEARVIAYLDEIGAERVARPQK
ncbi:MAG: competence/damage-inducible protein A [Pseudomonadota bacterium]|nr:competence/damage-inducible protein A [Pseudomonadota bacterium]